MVTVVLVNGQGQGDERPVVVAVTLRALTGGDPLPRPRREAGGDLVRSLDTQSGGDPVRAGDREDVTQLVAS